MDRIEARTRARELLDLVYMTAAEPGRRDAESAGLAELASRARRGGAPLDEHREGPWRSDRCRFGGAALASAREPVTCVMRGEFELPFPDREAAEVAALLNWAEVPEPGAQT